MSLRRVSRVTPAEWIRQHRYATSRHESCYHAILLLMAPVIFTPRYTCWRYAAGPQLFSQRVQMEYAAVVIITLQRVRGYVV